MQKGNGAQWGSVFFEVCTLYCVRTQPQSKEYTNELDRWSWCSRRKYGASASDTDDDAVSAYYPRKRQFTGLPKFFSRCKLRRIFAAYIYYEVITRLYRAMIPMFHVWAACDTVMYYVYLENHQKLLARWHDEMPRTYHSETGSAFINPLS